MALPQNIYQTFAAKGQREDLADAIYDISPDDTPLTSMAAKGSADAVLTEWQEDSLDAVDPANAAVEGDDANFLVITPTVRVGNIQQILTKGLVVSGTSQAVDSAGDANSLARQTARKGVEIKRDLETILFLNQGADLGSSSVARKMASLGAWVKTNVDKAGDGADPTWTAGVPLEAQKRVDGTQRAFTVTILKSMIRKLYDSGGDIAGKFVFLGPFNKGVFSGFAGVVDTNWNFSGRKPEMATIVGAADVYVSDFGTLNVLPSRFQRERDAWIINPDFVELSHLRPFFVKDLADTGDSMKKQLLQEVTLKVRTEKALALGADLTTS